MVPLLLGKGDLFFCGCFFGCFGGFAFALDLLFIFVAFGCNGEGNDTGIFGSKAHYFYAGSASELDVDFGNGKTDDNAVGADCDNIVVIGNSFDSCDVIGLIVLDTFTAPSSRI